MTPLIVAAAAAVGEELGIGVFDKVDVLASDASSIRVGPSVNKPVVRGSTFPLFETGSQTVVGYSS